MDAAPALSPDTGEQTSKVSLRQKKKDGRHAAILAAARRVFAEKGYEAASITEVARMAGVADGTIYRHFANKRDLLYQVMLRFYERIIADVEAEVAPIQSFPDRLYRLIRRHLCVFVEDVGLCRLFIRELRTADDYYNSLVHGLNRRYTSILMKILKQGIAAGEVDPGVNPKLMRDLVYGSIEHLAWRAVNGSSSLEVNLVARQLANVILGGIAREARDDRGRGAIVEPGNG